MKETPATAGQDLPSRTLYEGFHRAGARSFLYGIGYTLEDLERPIVGVAHSWTSTMPCNFNHRDLAAAAEARVRQANGTPMQFSTIAVSDGITMGTDGMRSSLISKEVIADSIELVATGHHFDALVCIASCDKTVPGCAMALARVNRPAVLLYGGTIQPGIFHGRRVAVGEVFEAVGAVAAGRMEQRDLDELERVACPGAGACGGQYTANTMSMVMEAIGISPLGANSVPATDPAKRHVARDAGALAMSVLAASLRPRDILTRPAFLNAAAAATASGGSTNAVLHLMAMAGELGIGLSLADIDAVSRRTPLLGDLKPGGQFTAAELNEAGGVALLLRELLAAGLIDGSAMTVTGRSIGEEIGRHPRPAADQQVIRPIGAPLSGEGGLCVLGGNIAPDGAVVKVTENTPRYHRGTARVFEGEGDALTAVLDGRIAAGDTVVIRYEGPRGGPGMPEMLQVTAAIVGRGLGESVRRAGDRRPVQRRHQRADGRPRGAGGRGRRSHRQAPRRRPDRDRRRPPHGHGCRRGPGRAAAVRQPQATTAARCLPQVRGNGRLGRHRRPHHPLTGPAHPVIPDGCRWAKTHHPAPCRMVNSPKRQGSRSVPRACRRW